MGSIFKGSTPQLERNSGSSRIAAAVDQGVKYTEGVAPLTPEEQQQLAKDVNEMFEVRFVPSL